MVERERERQSVNREGQRVGEAEDLKTAPGSELSAQSPTCGSNSRIVRSWPELQIAHLTDWATQLPQRLVFLNFLNVFIFKWPSN